MREADAPIVSAIDHASFSLPWPERSFLYEIRENEHSLPLVAETTSPDGKVEIIGFIVVWLIVDEVHIGSIAVDEKFRRKGVGEVLVRSALNEARQKGAVKAYLEVRAGNTSARQLYEKLGFGMDGIRTRYYQDNHEDAVLMSLESLEQY
jgi:ribosomal-protein-alanine N-acetyltransferase